MAKDTKTSALARRAAVDAILALIGTTGKLRIYTTAKPADADTALGAQTLLAELPLSNPAFGAASGAGASAAAGAITSDSVADATGTAVWGTFVTGAGVRVFDFTVGGTAQGDTLGTHDMLLNTTAIVAGAEVSCSAYSYAMAA